MGLVDAFSLAWIEALAVYAVRSGAVYENIYRGSDCTNLGILFQHAVVMSLSEKH